MKIEISPTGPVKSVDFLDLNLNLSTGLYAPYRKPLNKPLFIHKDSNHPPAVQKEVPRNVGKRLSNNSSNEQVLNKAKPPYEEALKHSGRENIEIKFTPTENTQKRPKNNPKSKKVLFCNLPWNMALKTNIGKEFLLLIDMFKNTPQGKYINRHTVKLSYSTMRNIRSHITASNNKKLKSSQAEIVEQYKCNKENIQCPVNKQQCMLNNVVYEAKVKTNYTTKSFIGMT